MRLRPGRLAGWRRKSLVATFAAVVVAGSIAMTGSAAAEDGGTSDRPILGIWEVQSLSGQFNNITVNTNWGRTGQNYIRVAPSRYADGRSAPVTGPNSRNVSNRVHNDVHQNLFSENQVTQWVFAWGQFIDHVFGLRDEAGTTANIPFNANDPLEEFTNTLGVIPFVRSKAAPGTGVTNPRQQVNTVSSYIEASNVYGDTDVRLDWLREGSVDGNPDNNGARLLMPANYLPTRAARGNPSAAPTMAIDGRLLATPNRAKVAGDVRANENIALTSIHTLFAREHNRIVSVLPSFISQQDKFQIARAVVIMEIQHITYTQYLPAIGVTLPTYQGYNPFVNATLGNEFATVGYRAHSMIHGELEIETEAERYSQAALDAMEAQGVEIAIDGEDAELAVPLNVAFFNPDLLELIQLGPALKGLGLEPQYKNDEQIDNQLRSVLFQVPVSGNPECLDGEGLPECFSGVVDLGAIDIERGRDHGMPSYNQLRNAYGLPSKTSFTSITGESTESFPPGLGVNSPACLDFVALFDVDGNPTTPEADDAVRGVRRCSLAAKLKAIYGSVSNVDAFVGILSEPHLAGREFGQTQLAIWQKQFAALRDGDRFFYQNDPLLPFIRNNFNIEPRKTLAEVIARNTDIPQADLAPNVFFLPAEEAAQQLSGGAQVSGQAIQTTTAPNATTTTSRRGSSTAGNSHNNRFFGMAATLAGAVTLARYTHPRRNNRRRRM
jgi:hypothetical protein